VLADNPDDLRAQIQPIAGAAPESCAQFWTTSRHLPLTWTAPACTEQNGEIWCWPATGTKAADKPDGGSGGCNFRS